VIAKNPMQLKAFVKNKAKESGISAQLVMQNFMMERLLERISLSKYKRNFILKGGFLIAAIVGLDSRATMDMDATVKGLAVTHESLRGIFSEICAVSVTDNITFDLLRTSDIREGDIYPGLRIHLMANYLPLTVPLAVDITTDDKITPREIEYSYPLLFDDRSISVMAYNLETILAEKLETVLSRNIANTRPRDFYDIYILTTLNDSGYDLSILELALSETTKKRGSRYVLKEYGEIVRNIRESPQMRNFWEKYRNEFGYAKGITFEDACRSVSGIMDSIFGSQ
jgi:predicted nucleotidyltransferase component of viral defense system